MPGPLSQLVLKRDGSVHIIGVGISWHAYGTINYRGVPARSGNYWSIGIEGVSNGYNDWTDAQRDSYPKVVAAILKEAGLPADAWIFHRDYQPGEKIDPGGFDKAWFDRMVRAAYNDKPLETAIQAKRRENTWLGNKVTANDELPTSDSVGRFAEYEHGWIYWHPNFGAKTINKNIFAKYSSPEVKWEMGELGYPTNDGLNIKGGEVQSFQGGSVYYNSTTREAFIVKGDIGGRWAELKWETGPLGFPQTDEIVLPDGEGRLQRFEGGHIYWHPKTGAKEIFNGYSWDEFARLGYEGALGYPTGTPVETQDRRGKVQSFQKGAIYELNGRQDASAITGDIFEIYGKLGYENGRLGMPLKDVYEVDGKIRADFEAGSIEQDKTTKDIYMVLAGKRVDIVKS